MFYEIVTKVSEKILPVEVIVITGMMLFYTMIQKGG